MILGINDVETFIRAFNSHYPGAFTYFNNKRVSNLKCEIIEQNQNNHAYFSCSLYKICDDGAVKVICKDGKI